MVYLFTFNKNLVRNISYCTNGLKGLDNLTGPFMIILVIWHLWIDISQFCTTNTCKNNLYPFQIFVYFIWIFWLNLNPMTNVPRPKIKWLGNKTIKRLSEWRNAYNNLHSISFWRRRDLHFLEKNGDWCAEWLHCAPFLIIALSKQ